MNIIISKTPSTARRITEINLCGWIGQASPGAVLEYHRGFLALDTSPQGKRLGEGVRAERVRFARRAWGAVLVVELVTGGALRGRDREGGVADGQIAAFAGFYGRWRHPARGLWRDPRRAFAALWNATHGTHGERWEDNPDVVVLRFRKAG